MYFTAKSLCGTYFPLHFYFYVSRELHKPLQFLLTKSDGAAQKVLIFFVTFSLNINSSCFVLFYILICLTNLYFSIKCINTRPNKSLSNPLLHTPSKFFGWFQRIGISRDDQEKITWNFMVMALAEPAPPQLFSGKGILKIYIKFTGEHHVK